MQQVTSQDGTTIAYDKSGSGPAVILVDGATGTRQSFDPLAKLLAQHFTVYAYDRRGRGDSTDNWPSSLDNEIDDIGSLINAAGGSASLYGTSSGGALALEAAIALQDKVNKLAVYEIPYDDSADGIRAWHQYRTELSESIASDRRGDAVALFMKFVGVPDDMLADMRQAPFWAGIEALAPTLLYDAAALGEDRTVPTDRAASVTAPTLVIDGGGSLQYMPFMFASAETLARAMPHATRKTLPEQTHDVDVNVLAPELIAFFGA